MIPYALLLLLLFLAVAYLPSRCRLLGPLFFYDLLRVSRRGRTIALRCLFASALLALVYLQYASTFGIPGEGMGAFFQTVGIPATEMGRFSERLFFSFMGLLFSAVFLLTPVVSAGAITEEKERRTLEFLLATDLYDREIILGKLLARVATMLFLLLTCLPFFGFLQFLGGVDPNLVLAGFAAAGMTVLSVASLGILMSVYSNDTLIANIATYRWMAMCLIVSVALPILRCGNIFVAMYRLQLPPFTRFARIFASPVDDLEQVLLQYVISHGIASIFCIIGATYKLRSKSVGRLDRALCNYLDSRKQERKIELVLGSISKRVLASVPKNENPEIDVVEQHTTATYVQAPRPSRDRLLLWKELGESQMTLPEPWIMAGFTFLLFFLLSLICHQVWWLLMFAILGPAINGIILLLIALHASSKISKEREMNTLDGLLVTQLGRGEILCTKFLASIWHVRHLGWWLGPMFVLKIFTTGLFVLDVPIVCAAWLILAAFSASLGLFFSSLCRTTRQATICTVVTLPAIHFLPFSVQSMQALSPAKIFWLLFIHHHPGYNYHENPSFFQDIQVAYLALVGYMAACVFMWFVSYRSLCPRGGVWKTLKRIYTSIVHSTKATLRSPGRSTAGRTRSP